MHVYYIIDDQEVERVLREKDSKVKKKKLRSSIVQEKYDMYEEENDKSLKVNDGKLTIKIGLMNKVVAKNKVQQQQQVLNETTQYKAKSSTARGNINKTYRMPHIALAATLEKELMIMWNVKKYYPFRYPVSEAVPGYYQKIQNPISLFDIRNKLGENKYLTAKAFIDDLTLMAQNCELFNGPNHDLTKAAHSFVTQLVANLTHDLRNVGKDPIKHMEDSIKKKFVYLKRSPN
jgi:hypothetical protein